MSKKSKTYTDAKNNDIQKIKDAIISTLLKEKLKIIVTIDDIDRLSNEEIISVFQLVKSLADFPYTIYLLAFDREVVIRALGEVQKGDGSEYLEKVIQVPFELPTPNIEDIHQVFFSKLDSIINISEEKWDKEYWSEMFYFGIKPYLKSIRDVVRFTNTFALKYTLLKEETNLIDLLGLTCIQVFEAEIYSRLPSQKDQLCGSSTIYDQYQREKEMIQNSYNIIIAGIPEERTKNIENILTKLFPKLNTIINNSFGFNRHYDYYKTLNNGNIANPYCFDRYFALTLEYNAIPQQEINYLLFHATNDELIKGIIKINSSKKTTRLLDYIQAAFEIKKDTQEYAERANIVFKCLVLYWHKLDNNEDSIFLSLPFDWRLLFCADKLMKVINEAERYDVVYTMFNDVNVDISTITTLLKNFENQHNRFIEKNSNKQDKLLTLDEVVELEKVFIKRTVSELESSELLNNSSAMNIIWLLEQIDETKAKKYTNKMIDSDLSLAKFISASVGHGKVSSRTVYKIWDVRKDDIKKYIDITSAFDRMTAFVYTEEFKELSEDKQENIAAFLIDMEKIDTAKSIHDRISINDIKERLNEISNNI